MKTNEANTKHYLLSREHNKTQELKISQFKIDILYYLTSQKNKISMSFRSIRSLNNTKYMPRKLALKHPEQFLHGSIRKIKSCYFWAPENNSST